MRHVKTCLKNQNQIFFFSFLLHQAADKTAEQPKRSDDEDEDIIDLGKDEDLDFEIKNDANPEPKVNKYISIESPRSRGNHVLFIFNGRTTYAPLHLSQIIESLISSCEPFLGIYHCFQNESWDTRWLRNNKVTKVLATTKLQNKLRSKIKQKKSMAVTEDEQKEDSNETISVEPLAEIPTSAEVGSVEHYKELTKKK